MIQSKSRLRYKIFTSFAIAVLALVALVRFAAMETTTAPAFFAYAIFLVLAGASFWRGLIYLRAVRTMAGPG
jgi:hypothetical protein